MAEVIYNTKSECLKAIESFKAAGVEPLPWMLQQLAQQTAEKRMEQNGRKTQEYFHHAHNRLPRWVQRRP